MIAENRMNHPPGTSIIRPKSDDLALGLVPACFFGALLCMLLGGLASALVVSVFGGCVGWLFQLWLAGIDLVLCSLRLPGVCGRSLGVVGLLPVVAFPVLQGALHS